MRADMLTIWRCVSPSILDHIIRASLYPHYCAELHYLVAWKRSGECGDLLRAKQNLAQELRHFLFRRCCVDHPVSFVYQYTEANFQCSRARQYLALIDLPARLAIFGYGVLTHHAQDPRPWIPLQLGGAFTSTFNNNATHSQGRIMFSHMLLYVT